MKIFLMLFVLLFVQAAHSQTTIYLVRHAEKQLNKEDPSLTTIGQFRAENIAKTLASVNISHIFSTNYKRTQETVKPLATLKNISIQSYDPSHLNEFAQKLIKINGSILVVGHSNTTPQLIALISGQKIQPINENEYDNLYQVILDDDKIMLNRLRTIPSYINLEKPLQN